MAAYLLRCVYRFLDGRSGLVSDDHQIEVADLNGAIAEAKMLSADKPNLTLASAVLTLGSSSGIVWSLQAPMSGDTLRAFRKGLPPGAGT